MIKHNYKHITCVWEKRSQNVFLYCLKNVLIYNYGCKGKEIIQKAILK